MLAQPQQSYLLLLVFSNQINESEPDLQSHCGHREKKIREWCRVTCRNLLCCKSTRYVALQTENDSRFFWFYLTLGTFWQIDQNWDADYEFDIGRLVERFIVRLPSHHCCPFLTSYHSNKFKSAGLGYNWWSIRTKTKYWRSMGHFLLDAASLGKQLWTFLLLDQIKKTERSGNQFFWAIADSG